MVLADPSPEAGRWLWLFPASYAVHIADEGLTGEGFYRWIGRISGREITPRAFVGFNLAYLAAMTVLVRRATRRSDAAWLLPALGAVTATNGCGHAIGSVATRTYSPGLASGIGLWAPLGAVALARTHRELARDVWRRGIAAGLLINAVVAILALAVSHRPATGGS